MRHRSSLHCLLARAVLAWFALTLTVAVASPIVHMGALQAICSSSGSAHDVGLDEARPASAGSGAIDAKAGAKPAAPKQEQQDRQESRKHPVPHTLDCALCLALKAAPSPGFEAPALAPAPSVHTLWPTAPPPQASLAGAPLPPRGPPPGTTLSAA